MSAFADSRLQRLLGGDDLAGLRKRLRRRFAYARADQSPARIHINGLTEREHAALASLTGRPQRFAASMHIDLGAIDASFRGAGIATSLRDALERLDGPILDVNAARQRERDRWARVVETCAEPALSDLLSDAAGLGLLRRLTRKDAETAAALCRRAEAVLQRLPVPGITRSQLAAETLGDAHALDAGQPVATLVLAARRRLPGAAQMGADQAGEPDTETDQQRTAERTRALWAAAGVLVNELARPALFLNLPVRELAAARAGEPSYLSLRALLRTPPAWDVSARIIHVCENPNLLAIAADHLGPRCAPLVCTDGMPAAAQRTLLSQLTNAGARLHYHGDYDWAGIRIANHMMREHGAQPWRFGVDDYLAAIRNAPDMPPSLDEPIVAASWDAALTTAMAQHRVAVAEEAVAAGLLQDLRPR